MNKDISQAKKYINEKNYSEALRLARRNHSKDNVEIGRAHV